MAYTTRWEVNGTTNEVVLVPVSFTFNGGADPVPLLDKSIAGPAITSITRTAAGKFTINLDQSWPFLLGDSLKVQQLTGGTDGWIVTACSDSVVNAEPASVLVHVYQIGVGLADPSSDNVLAGMLFFRNRLSGMLWRADS